MPPNDALPPRGSAPSLSDITGLTLCNVHTVGRASTTQIEHRLALLSAWGGSVKEGDRVLELGCGQGDCTSVLAAAVGETGGVTAVDPAPLSYGGPWNLGEAQKFLSDGPLGPRINWVRADPIDFLSTYEGPRFDVAVLAHCIYYFASPSVLHQTLSLLSQRAKTILIAEHSLYASTLAGQPHVLAVLAEAALEAHKPSSVSNVRTVVSPAVLKRMCAEAGLALQREEMIRPTMELQDGRWEIAAVMSDSFGQQVEKCVESEREKGVCWALRDACLAAVETAGGVPQCQAMDVWTGVFVSKS